MKTLLTIAVAMLASFGLINNAYAASPLKGGLCWTRSTIPNEYGVALHCEHLGEIKSTHEIYEKAFAW